MIDHNPNPAGEPGGSPQARSVPQAPSFSSLPAPKPRSVRGGPGIKEIRLKVKVVTPIMGGGTQTRTIDEVDIIRPATVRGHLRFWWRALDGSKYTDPGALIKQEGELWGRAAGDEGGRSTVDVRIEVDKKSTGKVDSSEIQLRSADSYATWTARAERTGNVPTAPRRSPGTEFWLTLLYPGDQERAVCNAVRAWLLFGGYGGRTRRGLGSLTVTENANLWLPAAPTRDSLRSLFGRDVFSLPQCLPTDTPWLDGAALHVEATATDAIPAWTTALGWLREFRQGTTGDKGGRAREPGTERPSVSNWPEADKIRHLTGITQGHRPRHNRNPVWPRAGFGLPIIGQFQTHRGQIKEPAGFELKWRSEAKKKEEEENEHERLASPLIVKALPLANGRFVPCALWLNRAYPKGTVFATGLPNSEAPFDRLVAEGDTPQFNALAGKGSLRAAFLGWLRRKYRTTEVAS